MRLSHNLYKLIRNLNKPYWDRRVWEIGYRGEPIASTPSDRPPRPVSKKEITVLKHKLQREYTVMQWLANTYLNEDEERPFVERYGTTLDEWRKEKIEKKHVKMPNKKKFYKADGTLEKCQANVGNLLHEHRTVEDSLKDLILRNRWD